MVNIAGCQIIMDYKAVIEVVRKYYQRDHLDSLVEEFESLLLYK